MRSTRRGCLLTTTDPIETKNEFFVGVRGEGEVLILKAPVGPLSNERALRLAAWLVAMATANRPGDPAETFAPILRAVLET